MKIPQKDKKSTKKALERAPLELISTAFNPTLR